jgi:alpha-tubulin suppressor-like RCC1 family protein
MSLCADGMLFMWGPGMSNRITVGNDTYNDVEEPFRIPVLSDSGEDLIVSAVSCGYRHTLVLAGERGVSLAWSVVERWLPVLQII